jgi:aspartokinase-like uncharacterized kinase
MATGADLPASWDVTSDTLAAWLAGEIGADRLVLVKSARLPLGPTPTAALARDGIVDPILPRRVNRLSAEAWCIARNDLPVFSAALDQGGPCGTRLLPDTPETVDA